MLGIELSNRFYQIYGKSSLQKEFSDIFSRLAIGIAGEGSDCFGFDDELSTDHDFEPGFCIWITKEDYEKFGFSLERWYSKLPKEFEGYSRQNSSFVNTNRRGIFMIDDFFCRFLGSPSVPKTLEQWLYIPHESLACACNGKIFYDGLGEFSKIRNTLNNGYPYDVKLKKLAAHCAMISQSGLYNYSRCIKRNETGAAQLAVFEFVINTISVIYLLNNTYEPFYKWSYRGLRSLNHLTTLESSLISLTELANSPDEVKAKQETIENISCLLVEEIKRQGFINEATNSIESCAFMLQNKIQNPTLRNMHIMDGI